MNLIKQILTFVDALRCAMNAFFNKPAVWMVLVVGCLGASIYFFAGDRIDLAVPLLIVSFVFQLQHRICVLCKYIREHIHGKDTDTPINR